MYHIETTCEKDTGGTSDPSRPLGSIPDGFGVTPEFSQEHSLKGTELTDSQVVSMGSMKPFLVLSS